MRLVEISPLMAKLVGITILIAAALIVFNRDKIESYKQRVIETINPAAKEKRLLGELGTNLDRFSATLDQLSPSDKQKISIALGSAKSLLQELKETNQKTDLGANLSNLLQKIVPLDLQPSPTWLPPGQECKNGI